MDLIKMTEDFYTEFRGGMPVMPNIVVSRDIDPQQICPAITVLMNDGSFSPNARAPQTGSRFERSVYLITASELAAAGFPSGTSPTTIGWNYAVGGAGSAPLIVYLQNTSDTTNLKSTTWATAITGMTVVHNATTALPAAAGPFDITLMGGSPFTYTGDGLYVAFDWGQYTGTLVGASIACNSTLTNGLLGSQSNVAAPTTIATSDFRPETRLNSCIVVCIHPRMKALTARGEIKYVEDVKPNDILQTANPEKPAKVILNHLNSIQHKILVQIDKDAISENVPNEPLLLTANHPVVIDGKYYKPRQLINGTTIKRAKVEPVNTYTIVTDTGKAVIINGAEVSTWHINKWNKRTLTPASSLE